MSTGALVALVDYGSGANVGGMETCVAGPPSFMVPRCPNLVPVPACIEAGAVSNGDASGAADH